MARQIYAHDIAAWKEKDALQNPTPVQSALMKEASERAEELVRAGWNSLSQYVRAQERDIAYGDREAPQLPPAATSTASPSAMLGHNNFDSDWEEVLAAREAAKRLAGTPR